ncbi:hypothetical protein KAR91_06735 [Candidatus Pacearchaeota archaeon]|nr:hypothetical protein [Candidatus Pacearchaeota archaeon]
MLVQIGYDGLPKKRVPTTISNPEWVSVKKPKKEKCPDCGFELKKHICTNEKCANWLPF